MFGIILEVPKDDYFFCKKQKIKIFGYSKISGFIPMVVIGD